MADQKVAFRVSVPVVAVTDVTAPTVAGVTHGQGAFAHRTSNLETDFHVIPEAQVLPS
jgi:hypothetical protein